MDKRGKNESGRIGSAEKDQGKCAYKRGKKKVRWIASGEEEGKVSIEEGK